MTLAEFLLARIAEDESGVDGIESGCAPDPGFEWGPDRIRAECEAKRRIVELHQSWPVLVEQQPEFDFSVSDGSIETTTLRMSQRIAWLTEQEYRSRFGSEPPTAPMLAALALPYADHPDFDEAWRP